MEIEQQNRPAIYRRSCRGAAQTRLCIVRLGAQNSLKEGRLERLSATCFRCKRAHAAGIPDGNVGRRVVAKTERRACASVRKTSNLFEGVSHCAVAPLRFGGRSDVVRPAGVPWQQDIHCDGAPQVLASDKRRRDRKNASRMVTTKETEWKSTWTRAGDIKCGWLPHGARTDAANVKCRARGALKIGRSGGHTSAARVRARCQPDSTAARRSHQCGADCVQWLGYMAKP